MIDWTKPVQTHDGRSVRILCTDHDNPRYPVVGVISGEYCVRTWTLEGRLYRDGPPDTLDLINVATRNKAAVWVNVWQDGHMVYHPSREAADRFAAVYMSTSRRACVKVEFEYTEGEGL